MTAVAILVLFALLMSLLRYSLPYLNEHKDKLEQYISKQYEIDLSIGELSANWKANGPALVLRNVSIKRGQASPIDLSIGEVFLEIDFWPSITSRSLQSDQVRLNKLNLDVDVTQIESSSGDFPIVDALESIFLVHLANFIVSDSRLTLITDKNQEIIDITRLSWLNLNNRHQGIGQFRIKDFSSNQANFILDLYGDVTSYSGTLFAEAVDVNLSSWINEFTGINSQLVSSKGNVKVWSQIDNGAITRLDGQLLPSSFEWKTTSATIENKVQANFAAINANDKWQFSIAEAKIVTAGREFTTNFNGIYSQTEGLFLRTDQPVSLKTLLPLSGLHSIALSDQLALLDFNARLADLSLFFNDSGSNVIAQIDNVSWMEFDNIFGLSDAAIDIYWQNNMGKINIISQNTSLSANYYLDRDVFISELNVPIFVDMQSKSIEIASASVVTDEIKSTINGIYTTDTNFLSLSANVEPLDLKLVPKWLPNKLVGANTKNYLTSALQGSGLVKDAKLLFHGNINNFPFESGNGIFQSRILIEDGDLLFSKDWPVLTNLDVELVFKNEGLFMKSSTSKLKNVELSDLTAQIPSLKPGAELTIEAKGEADSIDVTELMLQSSLANSVGKLLANDLKVDGKLATQLSLNIPLNAPQDTRAKGKVYIDKLPLSVPVLDLAFLDATGEVEFDNENIAINNLSASLWEQPINLNLTGRFDQAYIVALDINGEWDTFKLAKYIGDDFASYFSGVADLNLVLNMQFFKDAFEYIGTITSDLENVNSKLPYPYTKEPGKTLEFRVDASGNSTASSIDISIADLAKFDGALAHKERRFNRAHLALGPTELESRGLGFSISGDFESMEVSEWYNFIDTLIGDTATGNSLLGVPQRIFIDTERLLFSGQTINDVDVTIKRLDGQWEFDIDSDEIRGNVNLFDEWFSRGMTADLEYVRLNTNKIIQEEGLSASLSENGNKNNNKITIDPKKLPSLDIKCKLCEIDGKNLGRVTIEAQPNNDGLELSLINIENDYGSIRSSGQWYKRNQDHYTFIAGDMNSSDFSMFLSEFGTEAGIQDSSASINFALTWKDSPFDAEFKNLDGELNWQLSDGYLTDVSDKGSRIFTLLSLNSLVRKLSLDFRDVFASGFFYDNMSGSVQITEGKADTRDTNIDGAAGEIEIYGYTDLTDSSLNYNVSFTPNVTGNLPVLVYFFTVSPPTALAALAIDQVLTSAKVISNVNYSVTGTISEPILIETGRESTEVELPARRQIPTDNDAPSLFEPPTEDDLIEIETKDVQSD